MAISKSRVLTSVQPFVPVGAHAVDSTISASTTLTPETGATALLLQALTNNIRYTLDNSTPTASTGFQLEAGKLILIDVPSSGMTIKVIEETASASIQYQWGAY